MDPPKPELVCQELMRHRHRLAAFLLSALPDPHAVEDVLQEMSLVVIRKADQFQPGTNFLAWAFAIARRKLQENIRSRRESTLDEEFLLRLEETHLEGAEGGDVDRRKQALRECLRGVHESHRRILRLRYEDGLSPETISGRVGHSRAAVNSILQRLREKLRECVQRRIAAAEG